MIVAVFHQEHPDGTIRATCQSFPDWQHTAPSLPQSRVLAESSLAAHITRNLRYAHYIALPVNPAARTA